MASLWAGGRHRPYKIPLQGRPSLMFKKNAKMRQSRKNGARPKLQGGARPGTACVYKVDYHTRLFAEMNQCFCKGVLC